LLTINNVAGRKQCEQYWPETVEKPAAYGDLVVTKRAESVLPEYTIRILDIQMVSSLTLTYMLYAFDFYSFYRDMFTHITTW